MATSCLTGEADTRTVAPRERTELWRRHVTDNQGQLAFDFILRNPTPSPAGLGFSAVATSSSWSSGRTQCGMNDRLRRPSGTVTTASG